MPRYHPHIPKVKSIQKPQLSMELASQERQEMGSLPVPSVQAMVVATDGADVPPRYLRPEAAADAVTRSSEAQIPIIDYRRQLLDHGEESARLHRACQEWGFFQLINHSVPDDVMEGLKASIQEFFQLPAESKKQFA